MKKVFVGISGGVDSSVSALLLKKAGYEVVGVFIKVWQPDFIDCRWKDEMRDAMRVCAKLKIPFLLCDLEKEYKKTVVDYMISEYQSGRTPNPDVMCNKEIKFKHFLNFAISHDADYIATGHYAQIEKISNKLALTISKDCEKDQTYFLWNLNQKILEKTLFPIGHLRKEEVREIAKKNNLNTASKKDSQGLCFIGKINMKDFLKKHIETKSGQVFDQNNKLIGNHEGALLYTIGQRHGFEIFQNHNNFKNYYVVDKDLEKNILIVSHNKKNKKNKEIDIEQVNLIRMKEIESEKLFCRTRYRQELQKIKTIKIKDKKIKITFFEEQESITPGQSLVLYQNNECLGGGIIM